MSNPQENHRPVSASSNQSHHHHHHNNSRPHSNNSPHHPHPHHQQQQKPTEFRETVQIEGLKKSLNIVLPDGGPPGREDYVDYAIDLLVHNLIGAGQLDPSKAHLLKTTDVRDHVRSLADKAAHAKKAGIKTQITPKTTRWALQPNSLPITIVTNKDPNKGISKHHYSSKPRTNTLFVPTKHPSNPITANSSSGKASHQQQSSQRASASSTASRQQRSRSTKKEIVSDTIWENASGTADSQSITASLERDSSMIIDVRDEHDDKKQSQKNNTPSIVSASATTSAAASATSVKSQEKSEDNLTKEESSVKRIMGPKKSMRKSTTTTTAIIAQQMSINYQAAATAKDQFKVKLDFTGFKNEEISLDLDGHRLTITGIRPKRDGLNVRRATETLDIPENVNIDRLKVARRVDGLLVIQEDSVLEGNTNKIVP